MNQTANNFMKLLLMFVLLILSCILGICIGSVSIPLSEVLNALIVPSSHDTNDIIIRMVRLPRILGAVFAGVGLSCAGCLLQTTMSNALAAPNIIGVNAGAGLCVIFILVYLPGRFASIPLAAFAGAFLAALIVYLIALRASVSKVSVILAGVAVTSLLNALTNAILLFHPDTTIDASSFMCGSLSNIKPERLYWPVLYILVVFFIVLLLSNALNVLLLGDHMAASLGLRVKCFRFLFLLLAATLAGSVVSYAGMLGFVGLIVPHMSRRFIGNDARALLPFSAMLGAVIVVISDLIGRTIFFPYEIPVGIIMAFLGSPYFIYLLIRKRTDPMVD